MLLLQELRQQRWDDHRYYHHNRVNQSLHLLSALCFLSSYVLIFFEPVAAVFIGWLLAMVLRQVGHFYFEPKTYDKVNAATHQFKESIKVGYNLRRKVVLLSIWAASTLILAFDPTFFGVFDAPNATAMFWDNLAILWFVLGFGAVVFRTIHLFFLMGPQAGLAWFTKIATDPFHDVKIYYKAPYRMLRGEMYDDMSEWYDDVALTRGTAE